MQTISEGSHPDDNWALLIVVYKLLLFTTSGFGGRFPWPRLALLGLSKCSPDLRSPPRFLFGWSDYMILELERWVLWSTKWHAVFFHGCCSQIMVIKTPKPDKSFARVWWLTLHGIGFSRTLSMPWRSSWTRFQLKTFVELYSELHQWFDGP